MAATPFPSVSDSPTVLVMNEQLELLTTRPFEFIDLTPRIAEVVRSSGLSAGLVNIQTRHTTTAIVINEHEPLLLEDIEERLSRWAPDWIAYRHDDLRVRTVNVTDDERSNGHAHARAVVLRTSESVNVAGGALQLGRWQRIFLVELDGPQRRAVSVVAIGLCGAPPVRRVAAAPRRDARATREPGTTRCG